MSLSRRLPMRVEQLNTLMETILRDGRVPGAAIAIVADGQTVFTQGYGCRDVEARLPMTAQTVYPIGSTTKAMNATLLALLIEEGCLAWDTPVRQYLPRFALRDALASSQVTLRDLIVMRTGLPRHDWVWMDHPIGRGDLISGLRHLAPSAGFRERFQYNNLTAAVAGHLAEVVTGSTWEALLQRYLLNPLDMKSTTAGLPDTANMSVSFHEGSARQLLVTERRFNPLVAPAGSTVHSTVEDMARWISFNLSGGIAAGERLLEAETLEHLHSPQIVAAGEPAAPTPDALYAMGWFVDRYNGHLRISHGGFVTDVHGEVTLFPQENIGIVSFTNFGCMGLSRFINQQAFDLLKGLTPAQTLTETIALYEKKVEETLLRTLSVRRIEGTKPAHASDAYAGVYAHPAYGNFEIRSEGRDLVLHRHQLSIPLEHWHYEAWVARESDQFPIYSPHAFDRASKVLFETDADGDIAALSIRLEPAVAPIRFEIRKGE